MGITSDRNHPDINVPEGPGKMNKVYLVLSDEERAKGFIRPVRRTYVHDKCGVATRMGLAISETYARNPKFYGSTWCVGCNDHLPVSEFKWEDGSVLGS